MTTKITQSILDKQKTTALALKKLNGKINARLSYIVYTIYKTYNFPFQPGCWNIDAHNRDFYEDFLEASKGNIIQLNYHIESYGEHIYPNDFSYMLENNESFNIEDIQRSWLFEDFENQLIEAKKRWEDSLVIKKNKDQDILAKLKNKLSEEEIEFLKENSWR